MTTEDDFQNKLDLDPGDWQTRVVLADWLQDRDDPRADGYRALGTLRKNPLYGRYTKGTVTKSIWWFCVSSPHADQSNILEGEWWHRWRQEIGDEFGQVGSRREAEDAAALSFGKLSHRLQKTLLAEAPLPSVREAILKNPQSYMIFGDVDKPFHRPECECQECESWRTANDRPTHQELRKMTGGPS